LEKVPVEPLFSAADLAALAAAAPESRLVLESVRVRVLVVVLLSVLVEVLLASPPAPLVAVCCASAVPVAPIISVTAAAINETLMVYSPGWETNGWPNGVRTRPP
jgi:hypothetical protein